LCRWNDTHVNSVLSWHRRRLMLPPAASGCCTYVHIETQSRVIVDRSSHHPIAPMLGRRPAGIAAGRLCALRLSRAPSDIATCADPDAGDGRARYAHAAADRHANPHANPDAVANQQTDRDHSTHAIAHSTAHGDSLTHAHAHAAAAAAAHSPAGHRRGDGETPHQANRDGETLV